LQVLTPSLDLSGFFQRIAKARARLLMLDYDGTLAPFHVQPERAVPYPEVVAVLRRIVESGGTRIVVVSGRPADEVPPLLGLSARPEIWGSHGWERLMPDGRRVAERPTADAQNALDAATNAIQSAMPDGSRLERKLASIALHWRGLSPQIVETLRGRAAELWEPIAREGAVETLPFDGGLELRTIGCNKQYAVKAILSETAQESAVAYLGDDITDEDAFRAIKMRGIGVLVRPEFRETAADVWLRPPQELVDFMERWAVKPD
jgi:trehalose 6-phosphate phosphatase